MSNYFDCFWSSILLFGCISIIGQLAELPVLIGVVGEISADDEWDLTLCKFSFGEFVRIGLVSLWVNHRRCILRQLESSGSQYSGTLILREESWCDSHFCPDGTTLVSEAISSSTGLLDLLIIRRLFFGDETDVIFLAVLASITVLIWHIRYF